MDTIEENTDFDSLDGTSETDSDGFVKAIHPVKPRLSYMRSLRMLSDHGSALSALHTTMDLARCATFPNVVWVCP